MNVDGLRIERLTTIGQFHACEELQRQAWGMDDADVVALHLLITFQKNGGLVLGAFDDLGEMVGTLFGFLGVSDPLTGKLKHCSHMMGVREDWRGRGVGQRLKLAQREHALAQELDLVTWTYDPLESLNAALNIRKLGGICSAYVRDLYGEMEDGLNAGLGSDRFQLEWPIASARVAERLGGKCPRPSISEVLERGGVLLNPAEIGSDGLAQPSSTYSSPMSQVALVEIPASIQSTKSRDMDLARRWRTHTRAIFEDCFSAGHTVTDFVSEVSLVEGAAEGIRRSYYVLQKGFEVD